MLDVAYIRTNTDHVKDGMRHKGEQNVEIVDELIDVDEEWRSLVKETDDLRNKSNTKASKIGKLMGQGKKDEAQEIIQYTSKMKDQIKGKEEKLKSLKKQRKNLLLQIPNVPDDSVPVGGSEDENEVFKSWGKPVEDNWRQPHYEWGEGREWIDFERGAKVAGAGLAFYKGPVARLQRALINFFLNKAVDHGYTEMQVPYFVNEESARGTGQIPDKEDMMYEIPRDGFFNIPTAEVPVTNYHRDEIIDTEQLPVRYVAYTPCWRREAGSYGKDVRGLNRLHQFDKVELVKIVHPDNSDQELEKLRTYAESLLEALELPYRTLLMCTGDMGFTQSKKYDLEV